MLSRLDFNKYGAGMLSNKNLMDFQNRSSPKDESLEVQSTKQTE